MESFLGNKLRQNPRDSSTAGAMVWAPFQELLLKITREKHSNGMKKEAYIDL
jgi:hypothetical protein